MRPSLAISLLTAVLALAPAVSAQAPASVPLTPTVGSPIAYRIDLPTRWKKLQQENGLLMIGTERLMIVVGATDLMEDEANPLPVSEAESRRILTNLFLGSDSLMLAVLEEGANGIRRDGAEFDSVVREMRTLGGQRSAFMRGRVVADEKSWLEMHITVKDGVVYTLAFAAMDREFAANELLFARIRDSFVLAAVVDPTIRQTR